MSEEKYTIPEIKKWDDHTWQLLWPTFNEQEKSRIFVDCLNEFQPDRLIITYDKIRDGYVIAQDVIDTQEGVGHVVEEAVEVAFIPARHERSN